MSQLNLRISLPTVPLNLKIWLEWGTSIPYWHSPTRFSTSSFSHHNSNLPGPLTNLVGLHIPTLCHTLITAANCCMVRCRYRAICTTYPRIILLGMWIGKCKKSANVFAPICHPASGNYRNRGKKDRLYASREKNHF